LLFYRGKYGKNGKIKKTEMINLSKFFPRLSFPLLKSPPDPSLKKRGVKGLKSMALGYSLTVKYNNEVLLSRIKQVERLSGFLSVTERKRFTLCDKPVIIILKSPLIKGDCVIIGEYTINIVIPAKAGIQNLLKILDSVSRFACTE